MYIVFKWVFTDVMHPPTFSQVNARECVGLISLLCACTCVECVSRYHLTLYLLLR
jgi:hypothetical protein